ncbi:MAG: cysteine--tRNA ligase [Bacillota bacterium]|nr:cysteine--tRNA ligase [Bacillota bacterium]
MRVYNDLSRTKEELVPQKENHFTIYVCGPTVYDLFHLGNARPFIIYDTLRRYLLYKNYKVTYVQNFTDIDDKMINRAQSREISVKELADEMIAEYYHDADNLNVMRADHHPRATETIPEIIEMISTLEEKGYTYNLNDGVYYDTSKFEDYGKLSKRDLDDQEAGASERVDLLDDKRNLSDFVLWKFKKEGEPAWDSPWGEGRPGWHIECSAMSKKFLGETLDIHAGGMDLMFPHHENEIAQSEAANEKPFVNYWMHNGFINVDNVKMAKSGGNFFLVRELASEYGYDVLRFFILQAHYRMPLNFEEEPLMAATHGWQRVLRSVDHIDFLLANETAQIAETESEALIDYVEKTKQEFERAMDDDLNTPDAFAAIFNLVRQVNTLTADYSLSNESLKKARAYIIELCAVLGLDAEKRVDTEIPQEILDKVKLRDDAKAERDFATADSIRDELHALGYKIEDTPQGPKVSREVEK